MQADHERRHGSAAGDACRLDDAAEVPRRGRRRQRPPGGSGPCAPMAPARALGEGGDLGGRAERHVAALVVDALGDADRGLRATTLVFDAHSLVGVPLAQTSSQTVSAVRLHDGAPYANRISASVWS